MRKIKYLSMIMFLLINNFALFSQMFETDEWTHLVVIAEKADVYQKDTESSKILTTLPYSSVVYLENDKNDNDLFKRPFVFITTKDNIKGYIRSENLDYDYLDNFYCDFCYDYSCKDNAEIYFKSSYDSLKMTKLEKDTKILIIDSPVKNSIRANESNFWFKIMTDKKQIGYLNSDFINFAERFYYGDEFYSEILKGKREFDNSYQTAMAKEYDILKSNKYNIKRKGLILEIKLDNKKISLIDAIKNMGTWFNLIEVLDSVGYYLIHTQYYEGSAYLLINFHTGNLIHLDAYPYFSNDKNIIASCGYMYGESFLVELLIKNKNEKFDKILSEQLDLFGSEYENYNDFKKAEWINNEEFKITFTNSKKDDIFYKIIKRDDKWLFIKMAVIADDGLRVRKTANLNAQVLGSLRKGEEVEILEKGSQEQTINGITDYWYKILRPSDGLQGWCFGGYLIKGD